VPTRWEKALAAVGPAGVAAAGQIGILLVVLTVAYVVMKIIGGRKASCWQVALQ